jgi:hypothetical protein
MSVAPFHRRAGMLALAALGFAGGCSLPVDERVTPLDQNAIPDDLTEATTTTTTTTTLPPTTLPADTSVDSAETTTTTQPVIPTEVITVYYTRGLTDVMQPVEVVRAIGTPVRELILLLERPTGISEAGLRTSVLSGMIGDILVERGTATVVLDQDILDRMSNANQQRAIAQMVLTVTSFRTTDVGGIGRVRFEVDGEGFPVFVPAFGGSSEPGEELAFTDFQSLIATTPTPATTTTTTTTTTTPATTPDTTPPTSEP